MANGQNRGGLLGFFNDPTFQAGAMMFSGAPMGQAMGHLTNAQRLAAQQEQFKQQMAQRKASASALAGHRAATLGLQREQFEAGAPVRAAQLSNMQSQIAQRQAAMEAAQRQRQQQQELLRMFTGGAAPAAAGAVPGAGPEVVSPAVPPAGPTAGPAPVQPPPVAAPGRDATGMPMRRGDEAEGVTVRPIPPGPSGPPPVARRQAPSRDEEAPLAAKMPKGPVAVGLGPQGPRDPGGPATPAATAAAPPQPMSMQDMIAQMSAAERMQAVALIKAGKTAEAFELVNNVRMREELGGYKDRKQRFDAESKLRTEFQGVSKNFRTVRESFDTIRVAEQNPSPAGDLSMIYAYMKMLDPGSVVRESEFAMAARAGSLPTYWQNLASRAMSGTLSDASRNDFLDRANKLYKQRERAYGKTENQYRRLAKRKGFSPDDIVLDWRAIPSEESGAPGAPGGFKLERVE